MENNILDSKLFKGIVLGIVCLIILGFVFGMGVFVGTKKAEFSFRWADQYHRNIMGDYFTEANGVFGQIIKISGQTLTIKGRDNVEKNILVSDRTSIVYQRKTIKISDLTINENVVVIGDPDSNGQIQAELIRVMPAPPPLSPVQN